MSFLLDAYRSVVAAEKVRRQGNGHNGPCPFCGGSDSASGWRRERSDRFVVWPDKGFGPNERLGETCAEHRIAGVWYCRQCQKSGDTISFLMEAEGMTFKSACAELGITTNARRAPLRRTPRQPSKPEPDFCPKDWPIAAADPTKWREYATRLHVESRKSLDKNPHALAWLAARGLDAAAIERYQIGYLPSEGAKAGRIRTRSALGLPPKQDQNGKEKKHIFIPRGIVIPHFDPSGRIIRLRIRRPKPDVQQWGKKYMVLEGSSSQPMLLEATGSRQLACYVIVEAELDAMLIHHATGSVVGAFAALTNRGKPDPTQHLLMRESSTILVALDYDPRQVTRPDGTVVTETPGGVGWEWWGQTYKNAKRWPPPTGKDPGDAFAQGVDIRAWVALGLPASVSLPAPETEPCKENGTVEPFSSGLLHGGGGGTETVAPHGVQSSDEKPLNLPDYLPYEHIPPAILGLYTLWRSVPGFTVTKRDNGCAFRWDFGWAHASEDNWGTMGRLQDAILHNDALWDWVMNTNHNDVVTIENLFFING